MVEEFISSITTQLDRVQDALRIKAVNRPLTYALKELHLELKVFVDMDPQGQVLLRAAGPNEAGASTLAMDFTTITKPMIEENTISLAASRSTPLDNLGLKPEEQMKLERLGVTNLAQLERLKGSTGVSTVARMADMPIERLRRALQAGQPRLGGVIPPKPPVVQPPAQPVPSAQPVPPVWVTPRPVPPVANPAPKQPIPRPGPVFRPLPPSRIPLRQLDLQADESFSDAQAEAAPAPVLELDPRSRKLALAGSNLLREDYPPQVRLNGQALEIEELDDDRLVVRLPEDFEPGALEVRLGDQAPHCYSLVHPFMADAASDDPWAPDGGRA